MRTRQFLILLNCLTVLTACFGPSATQEMRPLGQITKVTLYLPERGNHTPGVDVPDKVISDPLAIGLIVAFINEERFGWGGDSDMFGVPVPDLNIYLYDGDVLMGQFGLGTKSCSAGRGFFETNMVYPFASKATTPERCDAFLTLLGVAWLPQAARHPVAMVDSMPG